jgi:hypothetical protein
MIMRQMQTRKSQEHLTNSSMGWTGSQMALNFTRPLSHPRLIPSPSAFLQPAQPKGMKCSLQSRILPGLRAILCSIPLPPASADSIIRRSHGHSLRNGHSMNRTKRLFSKKTRQLCSSHWLHQAQTKFHCQLETKAGKFCYYLACLMDTNQQIVNFKTMCRGNYRNP